MTPIIIDWANLELAFDSRMDDGLKYLDAATGRIVNTGLEADAGGVEDESELLPPRYLEIPSLESSEEYHIMAEFIATITDQHLQHDLQRSIHGQGAFRRFKDTLDGHPAERQRWFAYRDAELQKAMNAWLADVAIHPANPRDPLPVPGPHNEQAENPIAELDELATELTMLLIYLTSWEERISANLHVRKAWKGYTFEILNALEDRGLLHQSRKAKSVMLTDEGIALARDLLKRFHP